MDATHPPPDYEENAEQRDEDQAQDIAQDARERTPTAYDTEKGGAQDRAALTPQDAPDLVDRMNQMVSSGVIDNGAYAGEPMHDDEEDIRGETDDDELDPGDVDWFEGSLDENPTQSR